MFPAMEVTVLAKRSSDHHPIFVCLNESRRRPWCRNKQFRMEAGWCLREDYKRIVYDTWTERNPAVDPWEKIRGKIKRCQKATMMWVKKTVQVNEALLQTKTRELAVLQQRETEGEKLAEAELQAEIYDLMEIEDLKWKQGAKEDWLRNGDRNTKYFHACASQKKRSSTIEQIRDEEGSLHTETAAIEEAFVGYFQGLFTSARPQNVEKCISALSNKITREMNDKLVATFTKEEVKQALDQMGPLKAPAPTISQLAFINTIGPRLVRRYVMLLCIF